VGGNRGLVNPGDTASPLGAVPDLHDDVRHHRRHIGEGNLRGIEKWNAPARQGMAF
jgi:hypothetical protein